MDNLLNHIVLFLLPLVHLETTILSMEFQLIVVLILIYPVLSSIFLILMQGKTEVYESFYKKMQTEISYYEGCLGIKEMKIWMTSQNDIKCENIFTN